MSKREPSEYVKMAIGGFITLLTACLIGLFVWVFNMNTEAAVRDEKISSMQETQKAVIKSLDKNTAALNDLRVVIESLK